MHLQFTAETATAPRVSEFLFITTSMDDYDEKKRKEQNLFVRSGKSETEVTNNRRLRSTLCTIEAIITDRHEASRGLSAIAGLFVIKPFKRYKNMQCEESTLALYITLSGPTDRPT